MLSPDPWRLSENYLDYLKNVDLLWVGDYKNLSFFYKLSNAEFGLESFNYYKGIWSRSVSPGVIIGESIRFYPLFNLIVLLKVSTDIIGGRGFIFSLVFRVDLDFIVTGEGLGRGLDSISI